MEKWKIGVIVLLLGGLIGYGVMQNSGAENMAATNSDLTTVDATNGNLAPEFEIAPPSEKAAKFVDKQLGAGLPEWSNISTWANSASPVTASDVRGNVAMVEVFRTGCGHCEQAVPFMEALYERYQPRGLKMVAIQSPGQIDDPENPENNWQAVQTWAKDRGITYPIGFDEKSAWFQGKVAPQDATYPTAMVLDREGKVVAAQTGYLPSKAAHLALTLERLLPGKGSKNERARDLATFMAPFFGAKDNSAWSDKATTALSSQL